MRAANGGLRDAVGARHKPASADARILSLVPSATETLFDLGLGAQVVGRTHFCIHPADRVGALPSVGGTKKVSLRKVEALAPTHVILNVEENTAAMARDLAKVVPHVVVTYPQAPDDNLDLYRLLGGVFGRDAEAEAMCARYAAARQELEGAAKAWPTRRVLYFIWKAPWMTVARTTYVSRFLALAKLATEPAESTVPYPQVDVDATLLADVDLVLFSSEPYEFGSDDVAEFAALYAAAAGKLRLIDGEMTSWHGSRAIAGLDYLRRFVADLGR